LLAFAPVSVLTFIIYWLVQIWGTNPDLFWNIYGLGLFVFVPLAIGFLGGVAWEDAATYVDCVKVGWTALSASLLLLFAFSIEGAMCLIMASPLLFGISAVGSLFAWLWKQRNSHRPHAQMSVFILLPAALFVDLHRPHSPEQRSCTTRVIIHASPSRIWQLINNLSDLPEPEFWMFRNGVAYPVYTKTEGSGVGARRHCYLSTGDMTK